MNETWRLIPAPEPWLSNSSPTGRAAADQPNWLERCIDAVASWSDLVSPRTWALLTALTFVALLVSLPIARRQAYLAGRVAASKAGAGRRDKALFMAAMVPAGLFWLAVLAGSFRGLVAFARDTLHWHDGWELLVPFTLDGIAISFGFLAFRAVLSKHSPDRANNMVKGASLASALINYVHEANLADGSWLGGAYLALLSVFGVLIFHEFLEQFVEGTEYIQRVKPNFGLRWITWPTNTFCAWIAWQNYPPKALPADASKDDIRYWGSIPHAVTHLDEVRAAKRERQRDRDLDLAARGFRWWHWVVFWARFRQLDVTIADQKAAAVAERAEMERRFAEAQERFERDLAEAARTAVAEAEQLKAAAAAAEQKRLRAEQMAEQVRAGAGAKVEQLQMEHRREVERIRLEQVEQVERLRLEHHQKVEQLQVEQAHQLHQLSTEQARQLAAVLEQQDQRAQRDRLEQVRQVQAALAEQVEQLQVEHRREVERIRLEQVEQVERLQVEHHRKVEQLQVEHHREVEQMKVEQAKVERPGRSGANRSSAGRSTVTSLTGRRVDEDADNASLAEMFTAHPESTYEWGTREINRITGAGYSGRGPRLLAKATAHIESCQKSTHKTCFTEQASNGHSDVTSENTPDGALVAAGS